jgi:hypothetical protein
LLVVEDVSLQAHVKDSDQAVGQLAERFTVGLATSSELVLIAPRSRRLGQPTKGPLVTGVAEPAVAGEAGQDDPAVTRRVGPW